MFIIRLYTHQLKMEVWVPILGNKRGFGEYFPNKEDFCKMILSRKGQVFSKREL
jgi:hypothetical protein